MNVVTTSSFNGPLIPFDPALTTGRTEAAVRKRRGLAAVQKDSGVRRLVSAFGSTALEVDPAGFLPHAEAQRTQRNRTAEVLQ
jgi:hypothetical protein